MDLHILHKMGLKEKMADVKILTVCDEDEDVGTSIVMAIIKLFIAVIAAYISWTSSVNFSTPMRVIFSFFAFMFGGLYILLFLIFRSDIYDFRKLKLKI